VTAVSGRRARLLAEVADRGGMTLAGARDCYRHQGWQPADAAADLGVLTRTGDLTVAGQGAAHTWSVNLTWLGGGAA
jgi:hypothetical protein